MRKTPELFGDSGVDLPNAVSEKVAPQRRGAVEQAPATIVYEVVPIGTLDDERLGGEVLAHLSKRMPYVVRIPAPDVVE